MADKEKKTLLDATLYIYKDDIPWYQRSWIWGTAALCILLSGIVCGFLLSTDHCQNVPSEKVISSPDELTNLLAVQKSKNQTIKKQIAQLENDLLNGGCKSIQKEN